MKIDWIRRRGMKLFVHTQGDQHYIIESVDSIEVLTDSGLDIRQLPEDEQRNGFKITSGEGSIFDKEVEE